MTFLEFIIAKDLGEPTYSRGNGESHWPCPECDHRRFHTFPDKPEYKHRFKCWSCDYRGDAMDWLKRRYRDYGDRLERLAELKREYETLFGPCDFSPGSWGSTQTCEDDGPEHRMKAALTEMFSIMHTEMPKWVGKDRTLDVLRCFVFFADIADRHQVPLHEMAIAAARYVWQEKQDRGITTTNTSRKPVKKTRAKPLAVKAAKVKVTRVKAHKTRENQH